MKKLVLVALVTLCNFAPAMFREGVYQGKGIWKAPDQSHGTWTETMTVKKDQNAVTVTYQTKVYHDEQVVHEETGEAKFVATSGGFFDVQENNQSIGQGYCFKDICHIDYQDANKGLGEETMHVGRLRIHKMGSLRGEHAGQKFTVAWRGLLTRKP